MAEPQKKEETAEDNLGKPLDRSARKALEGLTSELRRALLIEANKLSKNDDITEEDIYQAFKRLNFPDQDSLQFADAQAVISQALRENRFLEWFAYAMAIILFVAGVILLFYGAAQSNSAVQIGAFLSGSILELLILMPFRFAINSRRQNIALRMLGLILNRVDDTEKLAPLLKDTFLAVVLGKAQFKKNEND